MNPLVGDRAPDFTAKAFYRGKEETLRLSTYRGRWVALLFYPGDFTTV